MAEITIYHNQRCRKSREALALLNEYPYSLEIIEYLKTPLTTGQVEDIAARLDVSPQQLIRKEESIYKDSYKDKKMNDKEWVRVLVENPILLQRPIVLKGERGVIARPPELINEFLA